MKRKRNLIILLILTSSIRLLADDHLTLPPEQIPISSAPTEIASSTERVITQTEFDGTDPIVISLHESLDVPIHYERHFLTNNIQIFFGVKDKTTLNVIAAGSELSSQGMILDINLIFRPLRVGVTQVDFGEHVGNQDILVKKFNVQVVE